MPRREQASRMERLARSWVVSLVDPADSTLVCTALKASGGIVHSSPWDETIVERCKGYAGIAIEVTGTAVDEGLGLVRELRDRHPALLIVVVSGTEDVASSWSIVRLGAMPWLRPSTDGTSPWPEPTRVALVEHLHALSTDRPTTSATRERRAVGDALADVVTGRTHQAVSDLCRLLHSGNTALALEVLTEMQTVLLERLAARSQYPISPHYVVDQLDVEDQADRARCASYLHRRMLSNPEVAVTIEDLLPDLAAPEQLYVVLQATAALARFAAARSWVQPDRLLDQIRGGASDGVHPYMPA